MRAVTRLTPLTHDERELICSALLTYAAASREDGLGELELDHNDSVTTVPAACEALAARLTVDPED